MTGIMTIDEPRPRGSCMGKQVSGPRLTEAEHFRRCRCATAISTCAIAFGLKITKARCRTRRRIGRSSACG
jgi:hypothetical protein